jgi:hypothetical protein
MIKSIINISFNQTVEHDENEYVRICRYPGGLDEEMIVQIAGRIRAHFL